MQTRKVLKAGGRRVGSDAALTGRDTAQRPDSGSALEDVRWEKILSLRAALACGRYNIAAEALAAKLMEHMLVRP